MDFPLVSCICVTHHALDQLKTAIACFHAQTYPNKELIILHLESNTTTSDFLVKNNFKGLVHIVKKGNLSLGAQRNEAIRHSSGRYVCIWDDDDWHHPSRIGEQMNALKSHEQQSCCLENVLLYNRITGVAYLSFTRPWEGTLVMERSLWESGKYVYEQLPKGEDSSLVYRLFKEGLMVLHPNPYLYFYRQHAYNTWDAEHWENNIYRYAMILPDEIDNVVRKLAEGQVSIEEGSRLLNQIRLEQTFDYKDISRGVENRSNGG